MSIVKKTILGFIGNKVLSAAQISDVKVESEHFRWIEIQSDSFETLQWQAGDKLQINTGQWNIRTFTPISLDARAGKIRILAFLHGKGPGWEWASKVKVGDDCQVLGPRSSLPLGSIKGAAVFFGDETSFGAASTLQIHLGQGSYAQYIFEVSQIEECQKILTHLGLSKSLLIKKEDDDSHLKDAFIKIKQALLSYPGELVLTGKASSIQTIRNKLKSENALPPKAKVKAYWAPGKEGLD